MSAMLLEGLGEARPRAARDAFRKVLLAISEGIEVASRYRILCKMSDAELTKLGLTRKDVFRVTFNGLGV